MRKPTLVQKETYAAVVRLTCKLKAPPTSKMIAKEMNLTQDVVLRRLQTLRKRQWAHQPYPGGPWMAAGTTITVNVPECIHLLITGEVS